MLSTAQCLNGQAPCAFPKLRLVLPIRAASKLRLSRSYVATSDCVPRTLLQTIRANADPRRPAPQIGGASQQAPGAWVAGRILASTVQCSLPVGASPLGAQPPAQASRTP